MERRTRGIINVPMILLFIRIGNQFTFALQQQIFATLREKNFQVVCFNFGNGMRDLRTSIESTKMLLKYL